VRCVTRELLTSIEAEFRRYKKLGDETISQLRDAELTESGAGGGNSIAILVWHLSGNLKSRFTDFLTSDGEKPWRHRDEEFQPRQISRAELLEKWEEGWITLFKALDALTDDDLFKTVVIRSEHFQAHEALHRLMAHASYHVGQMVYLGKAFRASDWKCLSIPPGRSQEFNLNPSGQRPAPPDSRSGR
jgi:uncharacterized damage-inducible protein DinB